MTKRMREESDDEEMDIPTTDNLLLSLDREASPSGRRFVCKTCSRHFRSFQALGGHCTSHKRAGMSRLANPFDEMQRTKSKGRTHKCSACGLKFGTGQALGGHMRRHKGLFRSRRVQLHDMGLDAPRLLNLFT